MLEYREIRKRMFYEGVELASFFAEYPFSHELGHISELFEDIAQRCFNWFCTEYYSKLTEEYIADTNPKKRFCTSVHRYTIKFTAGLTDGEHISVKCEMRLCRGKKELISEYNDAYNFEVSQGLLISPDNILKKTCPNIRKKERSSLKGKPIYINEINGAFYFDGREWVGISE